MSSKKSGVHVRMQFLSNIQTLSHEQLTELYGIDINENGSVFDPITNVPHKNLKLWAELQAKEEQEAECGTFEKRGARTKFDDEY